jgi:GT2 family glycosyltransferase
MSEPLVYVLILNWNLKDDTAECVASVLTSDYKRYRILVVDNGSSDGSAGYLRRTFPGIDLISSSTNVGFAAGSNIGIRHALRMGAECVFLLNNDATVDAGMLTLLVQQAQGDASLGMVAPKILYDARSQRLGRNAGQGLERSERRRIWRLGERIRPWLPVPASIGRDEIDRGQYTEPFEVDYVTFCGVLIKRSVLEAIGLLDERFVFAYEDADFCRRTCAAGYRIVCEPRACMWHKVSLSAQKDAVKTTYLKSKGRAIFYRRYSHGPHPWLTAAYLWANTLVKAGVYVLSGYAELARQSVCGLYDGFREPLVSA